MTSLSPSQMAKMKIGLVEKKAAPKPEEDVVVMPAFVPTKMNKGEGILEVTTRQKYLNEGYADWINWHLYRIIGIGSAVAALFLIGINLWLAAGAGAIAGHFYSEHVRIAKKIAVNYSRRRLLYTR